MPSINDIIVAQNKLNEYQRQIRKHTGRDREKLEKEVKKIKTWLKTNVIKENK